MTDTNPLETVTWPSFFKGLIISAAGTLLSKDGAHPLSMRLARADEGYKALARIVNLKQNAVDPLETGKA